MKHVHYSVAMTLDGYIARPDGEYDWIPEEPEIDWGAFLGRFDTVLMGRGTYDVVAAAGPEGPTAKMETLVFSTTLDPEEHPDVRVVAEDAAGVVEELRRGDGKDIWLMGGGVLFRTLLDAGLVDRVETAVVPLLLGRGIPFLPEGAGDVHLALEAVKEYPSGIVLLSYGVERDAG